MPKGVYKRTAKGRANMSKSARSKPPITEETRLKMSIAQTGEGNGMYGKKHSPETISKLSDLKDGDNNPMYGIRGGQDLVVHHYIYDHSDLSKYTMGMTRSRHQRLHQLMKGLKIKIPHINIQEGI